MRFIELSGSWREIGRQQGEAFPDDIRQCYDRCCVRTGRTPENIPDTIDSICRYAEEHIPTAAEEMAGIAEGASLSYPQIMALNNFNVITGCTPLWFRKTDVGPILSQNLDCGKEEISFRIVRKVVPNDGHAYLCTSSVGTVWTAGFINSAGVCQAGVSAHQEHYRRRDGASGNVIIAQIAQQADTVDDVLTIMQAHCFLGKVGVYLFADAGGEAMMIEGTSDEKFGRWITEDFAYSTGLYTSGHVTAKPEEDYLRPKRARAETIEALYHNGEIEYSLEGMKRLMSHHAPDPGSICRHNPDQGLCTQHARIMLPERREMLLSDGPPCNNLFTTYSL